MKTSLPPSFHRLFRQTFFATLGGLATLGCLQAAEVELDLATAPRIYSAEGSACTATPSEAGTGVRLTYDFENSTADWAHFQFVVPAIDQPISRILITAKGSPARTAFAARSEGTGKAFSWRFGPPSEDDFQTFEIDLKASAQSPDKQEPLQYPVAKVFFQIKATEGRKGFLEVSKVVIETAD